MLFFGMTHEDEIDTRIEDLKKALRDRRKREKLSLQDVESRGGVTNSTTSYMELHAQFRELKNLMKLAAVYGVELPDLAATFRGTTNSPSAAPPQNGHPSPDQG